MKLRPNGMTSHAYTLDGGPDSEGVVRACEKWHDARAKTLRGLSREPQLCSEVVKRREPVLLTLGRSYVISPDRQLLDSELTEFSGPAITATRVG